MLNWQFFPFSNTAVKFVYISNSLINVLFVVLIFVVLKFIFFQILSDLSHWLCILSLLEHLTMFLENNDDESMSNVVSLVTSYSHLAALIIKLQDNKQVSSKHLIQISLISEMYVCFRIWRKLLDFWPRRFDHGHFFELLKR